MKTLKNIIETYNWLSEAFVHQTDEKSESDILEDYDLNKIRRFHSKFREYLKETGADPTDVYWLDYGYACYLCDEDIEVLEEFSDKWALSDAWYLYNIGMSVDGKDIYLRIVNEGIDGRADKSTITDISLYNLTWDYISRTLPQDVIEEIMGEEYVNESFVHQTDEKSESDTLEDYDLNIIRLFHSKFREFIKEDGGGYWLDFDYLCDEDVEVLGEFSDKWTLTTDTWYFYNIGLSDDGKDIYLRIVREDDEYGGTADLGTVTDISLYNLTWDYIIRTFPNVIEAVMGEEYVNESFVHQTDEETVQDTIDIADANLIALRYIFKMTNTTTQDYSPEMYQELLKDVDYYQDDIVAIFKSGYVEKVVEFVEANTQNLFTFINTCRDVDVLLERVSNNFFVQIAEEIQSNFDKSKYQLQEFEMPYSKYDMYRVTYTDSTVFEIWTDEDIEKDWLNDRGGQLFQECYDSASLYKYVDDHYDIDGKMKVFGYLSDEDVKDDLREMMGEDDVIDRVHRDRGDIDVYELDLDEYAVQEIVEEWLEDNEDERDYEDVDSDEVERIVDEWKEDHEGDNDFLNEWIDEHEGTPDFDDIRFTSQEIEDHREHMFEIFADGGFDADYDALAEMELERCGLDDIKSDYARFDGNWRCIYIEDENGDTEEYNCFRVN